MATEQRGLVRQSLPEWQHRQNPHKKGGCGKGEWGAPAILHRISEPRNIETPRCCRLGKPILDWHRELLPAHKAFARGYRPQSKTTCIAVLQKKKLPPRWTELVRKQIVQQEFSVLASFCMLPVGPTPPKLSEADYTTTSRKHCLHNVSLKQPA